MHLAKECPVTVEHLQVHFDSMKDSISVEDWEQVAHEAHQILMLATSLHERSK